MRAEKATLRTANCQRRALIEEDEDEAPDRSAAL